MNRVVVTSRVGADGILHVDFPLGPEVAEREVRVTIEAAKPSLSESKWHEFIRTTAGAWQGDFVRPPQGEFESRDPL